MKNSRLIYNFVFFFIFALLLSFGFLSNINPKITDNFFGNRNINSDIVVLAIDDKSLQEIGRFPWDRSIYANLIEKISCAKVIGIDIAFFEESSTDYLFSEVLSENVVLASEYVSFEKSDANLIGVDYLLPFGDLSRNSSNGYINVFVDRDGIARAININIKGDLQNFAKIISEKYLDKKIDTSRFDDRFIINYVGEPGSFKYDSISDVLNNSECEYDGKIILVGATSQSLHDVLNTPVSKGKLMPGVEVHANIINTLIEEDYLEEQSSFSVIVVLFFIFLFIYFIFYKKIWFGLIFGLLFCLVYLIFGIFIFETFNILLNVFYPIFYSIFAIFLNVSYLYTTESKHKKEIVGAFSKYVSPDIVNDILKNPSKLNLGGERRNISILFSDIRGFTSLSEKLSPEKLVLILNEYLTEMTSIVLKNKGLIDKFIGDAIMALWGTPLDLDKHPDFACKSAMEMIENLTNLNKDLKKRKLPQIDIGIGINTGECVVGNMGSNQRFDYTAMGDNVNLASRLEGLNKIYGTNIIISENTARKISSDFKIRKLDKVCVKGKKKPILIYELNENLDSKFILKFEKALNEYFEGNFEKAMNKFSKLDDFASKMFVLRCKEFISEKPKNWKGAYEMKTK